MAKWGNSTSHDTQTGEISTLLGKDTEIRGSIKTQGSIRLDGIVIGEVTATKTVTIGATGSIEGNIQAEDIILAGKVKGTIMAKGKVLLESSAQLEGDLHAARLSISEGASFKGRSTMGTTAPMKQATLTPEDRSVVPINTAKPAEKVAAA